jgi:hypothetical protein
MIRASLIFLTVLMLMTSATPETAEYAEIFIFRPKQFQGGAITFQVLANQEKLLYLTNGSRSVVRVYNEGALDLQLKASVFTSKTISFGIVKGQKYFVKAGYDDGFGSNLSFVPLEENQGKTLFEDTKVYHRPKIKVIDDMEGDIKTLTDENIYLGAMETIEKPDGAKPGLGWISPVRNNLKTDIGIFALQLCLTSEAERLNLIIKHNGEIFDEVSDIEVTEKKCAYTYIGNVQLSSGVNKIEVFLNDINGESSYTRLINYKEKEQVSKRGLALVLGNSDYKYTQKLPNPVNDANDMENALKRLDFEVMKFNDLGYEEMKQALGNFLLKLEEYETGVVFYAGHGIQHGGRNYLIPVDVSLENEGEVISKCIDTGDFITKMDLMDVETSVIILDACRSTPFKNLVTKTSDSTNGLTGTDAPAGTIVAFATAPGKTASDGIGLNGLYTQEILNHIYKPGLKVEDLFKRVRISVMNKSLNRQIPWETSSLVKDFYFYQESN